MDTIPRVFMFNSWLFVLISSYFSHLFWAFAHQIEDINIKNQSTYIFMSFPAEQKRTTDGKYEKTIVLEICEAQVA